MKRGRFAKSRGTRQPLYARPVGAQSVTATDLAPRILRIELTKVVLPTPGPPVTTSTWVASAGLIAERRPGARTTLSFFSTHAVARSASIAGHGLPAVPNAER